MRFSIRDLLWLTVVVAIAVGWWLERRANQKTEIDLERTAEMLEIQSALTDSMIREATRAMELLNEERKRAESLAQPAAESVAEPVGGP